MQFILQVYGTIFRVSREQSVLIFFPSHHSSTLQIREYKSLLRRTRWSRLESNTLQTFEAHHCKEGHRFELRWDAYIIAVACE